jgi:exodeoxyribonuclease VII small subunit
MEETITYQQALAELEKIHQKIEQGEVELEQLVEYTRRAQKLVSLCETKLREAQDLLTNSASEPHQ